MSTRSIIFLCIGVVLAGALGYYIYTRTVSADSVSNVLQGTTIQIVDENGDAVKKAIPLQLTLLGSQRYCTKVKVLGFFKPSKCKTKKGLSFGMLAVTDSNGKYKLDKSSIMRLSQDDIKKLAASMLADRAGRELTSTEQSELIDLLTTYILGTPEDSKGSKVDVAKFIEEFSATYPDLKLTPDWVKAYASTIYYLESGTKSVSTGNIAKFTPARVLGNALGIKLNAGLRVSAGTVMSVESFGNFMSLGLVHSHTKAKDFQLEGAAIELASYTYDAGKLEISFSDEEYQQSIDLPMTLARVNSSILDESSSKFISLLTENISAAQKELYQNVVNGYVTYVKESQLQDEVITSTNNAKVLEKINQISALKMICAPEPVACASASGGCVYRP